ncbi:MAG TPA: ABC transporter permease [Chitinophagaceae bacterium]|nr:ABC transporter permease [Chitinophagaceae bacterium]
MNKIWLIIKREYITRVRNRTFLISTFLLPIVIILLIFGSVFIAVSSKSKIKVAVANDTGFLKNNIKSDSSSLTFHFVSHVDSLTYAAQGYDAVLYIPSGNSNRYLIYSKKQLGLETESRITNRLNKAVENNLLLQKGIHKETLDSITAQTKEAVELNNRVLDESGKTKEAKNETSFIIAYSSGILIYITMIVFGAMVMRGVMEEKTNRIAEVIISSVKPFQLMIGKIIGIAGVGLTQFLLWIILVFALTSIVGVFIPPDLLQRANEVNSQIPGAGQNTSVSNGLAGLSHMFGDVNWVYILGCFLFYFLGGYLFYSALFAAVGSVVEDAQESQSLMFPVMMPIIFAFIILSSGLRNINSPLMFWGSMIPFTSPVIMMGRIPFGVPWWQLGLSMLLLILGFFFTTWMAGKIYRTGILLYGKKASWKEMLKWAFKKS